MDMFDEARAMQGTMRLCQISQRELAERLGVSQSYVANKLRLLTLDDEEIRLVRDYGLTERHVRATLTLDRSSRLDVLGNAGKRGLTVRECEALATSRRMRTAKPDFSRKDGLSLLQDAEGALKRITEDLISAGVEARLHTTVIDGAIYMTIRINNP